MFWQTTNGSSMSKIRKFKHKGSSNSLIDLTLRLLGIVGPSSTTSKNMVLRSAFLVVLSRALISPRTPPKSLL